MSNPAPADALPYISQLLLARLEVMKAASVTLRPGKGIAEEVLAAPRIILFTAGRAQYTVEDQVHEIIAPQLLLIPAWLRRTWKVAGKQPVRIAYVNFLADPAPPEPSTLFALAPASVEVEAAAIDRVIVGLPSDPAAAAPAAMRAAEGEIKAILARLITARPLLGTAASGWEMPSRGKVGVNVAVRWLAAHYAEPDALAQLPEQAGLSANHFRLAFRRLLGRSPQDHLIWLRRAARVLLQEQAVSVKEVARRVGYADTTHFTRQYRKFWGRLPSHEGKRT